MNMVAFINKLRAQSLKPDDLSNAVASRNVKKVDDILSMRPDLVNATMFNKPIFYSTCKFDKIEMCRLFISKGAQVTGAALLDACFNARPEIIQLLLDSGADVSERDSKGKTVLHSVCHNGDSKEVLPLLIARGADINAKDNNGATPLHHAAQNSMEWQIEIFVNAGANVNAQDNNGKTPIHYAIEGNGGAGMTEALLQFKADPNLPDADGKTPFDYGLLKGHSGRLHNRILEQYGGKPRSVSKGRLLPEEFNVELPKGTREGYGLYTSHISYHYDVIGAIHAWYDNDCRSAFGVEKATMLIRSIGDELNRQGGFTLMSDVATAINREYPGLGTYLNNDWHGIGSWQA